MSSRKPGYCPAGAHESDEESHADQHDEQSRNEAAGPPGVKPPETNGLRPMPLPEQNERDEKAGQHEERIHSEVATHAEARHARMEGHDGQDGETSKPIERRHPAAEAPRSASGLHRCGGVGQTNGSTDSAAVAAGGSGGPSGRVVAASRVHPWRSPSGRRSRSGDAPLRPFQLVRVFHSHDHTFRPASSGTFTAQLTPLAQRVPAVAGSECRDHAPAPTLPGVPPGANQVNTPDHTPVCHAGHPHRHGAERRRSLANSRHGESATTSQCDQEGRPVLPRRNGEP